MPVIKPVRGIRLNKSYPLARGLLAYWPFNEGVGGKVFDSSGNGRGGVFYNGADWAPGKFGSAVRLDGVDGLVDYGRQRTLELLNNFTIVISVTVSQISQYDCFFVNCTSEGRGWRIWTRDASNYRWYFECYDGAVKNIISTNPIVFSQEQQLVCVHDGANILFYFNGQPTGTPTACGDVVYAGASEPRVIMGDMLGGDWPTVRGRCPAVKNNYAMLYNRVLSALDVARLSQKPFRVFEEWPSPKVVVTVPVAAVSHAVGFKPIEGAERLRGLRRSAFY